MIHFHLLKLIFQGIVIETRRKIGKFLLKMHEYKTFFQLYSDVEDQTLENSSIKKVIYT